MHRRSIGQRSGIQIALALSCLVTAALLAGPTAEAATTTTAAIGTTTTAGPTTSGPPPGYHAERVRPRTTTAKVTVQGATEDVQTLSWNIPAGHYVLLNKFTCPSWAKWLKSNGKSGKSSLAGYNYYEADLQVDASSGVGYKGFARDIHEYQKVRGRNEFGYFDHDKRPNSDAAYYSTGWLAGEWTFNSIWAPPFENGTFKLKLVCTSALDEAAFSTAGYESDIFPWKH
jgi:hypothetical protein